MQDSEIEKAPVVICSEGRSFEQITDQELESCFRFSTTHTKYLGVLTQDDTERLFIKESGAKAPYLLRLTIPV